MVRRAPVSRQGHGENPLLGRTRKASPASYSPGPPGCQQSPPQAASCRCTAQHQLPPQVIWLALLLTHQAHQVAHRVHLRRPDVDPQHGTFHRGTRLRPAAACSGRRAWEEWAGGSWGGGLSWWVGSRGWHIITPACCQPRPLCRCQAMRLCPPCIHHHSIFAHPSSFCCRRGGRPRRPRPAAGHRGPHSLQGVIAM